MDNASHRITSVRVSAPVARTAAPRHRVGPDVASIISGVDNPRVLDSLLAGPMAGTIADALTAARVGSGPVAVLGSIRLSRALAARGHEVIHIGAKAHPRIGEVARQLQAKPDSLPLADGDLAALVVTHANARDLWDIAMPEWQRVVSDGGALILIARTAPTDATHRALCGHLADIEQRRSGRTLVTSGRVSKL